MTDAELKQTLRKIDQAFNKLAGIRKQGAQMAPYVKRTDGKAYEVRVLAWLVAEILAAQPGTKARLVGPMGATAIKLRLRPGKLDRNSPHLELFRKKGRKRESIACIWMNVEITSLWSVDRSAKHSETSTDFHELDLAVTTNDVSDGTSIDPHKLHIGVECKDREIGKETVRELLGIRRLISFYAGARSGAFKINGYPPELLQNPPSRLFLCTSKPLKTDYDKIDPVHGIVVRHLPL